MRSSPLYIWQGDSVACLFVVFCGFSFAPYLGIPRDRRSKETIAVVTLSFTAIILSLLVPNSAISSGVKILSVILESL